MIIRRERVFVFGLLEQLRILLVRRTFDLGGGNQFGKGRGFANLDAIARKQGGGGKAKGATCAAVYKLTFVQHGNEISASTSQYKV